MKQLTFVRSQRDSRYRGVVAMHPPTDRSRETGTQRLLVRDNGRFLIIRSSQIDWIETKQRNCIVHCDLKKYRVPGPFSEIVTRLGEDRFVQVSRFSLVNIDRILHLAATTNGVLCALMKNGDEVSVSRRFRGFVMAHLAT